MSLQHLILGVLKYQPTSGYDLNKAFQVSVQHFWDTDQSQIYRALYKMLDLGWVAVEVIEQSDAPDKKLYRLTQAGWAELLRWLAAPMPMPALHEGWLGQLFFAAEISREERIGLLEARIAEAQAILDVYVNVVPASAAEYAERYHAEDEVRYWLLTLNYGIEKMRFDIQWAQAALDMMKTGE
jgi:PadR family transcriptional regulator AphA